MPETILQFDTESRCFLSAVPGFEAERQGAKRAIVEFLKAAGEGKIEPEIDEQVDGKTNPQAKGPSSGVSKKAE